MRAAREIFSVNETYTWLREPLLARLPDRSLCCAFFTGGRGDGDVGNVIAPNEKDYDDPRREGLHGYRTPLEMWVTDEDLRSWYLRKTLIAAPAVAQYPDGFYDYRARAIYLVWENDRTIFFCQIPIDGNKEGTANENH